MIPSTEKAKDAAEVERGYDEGEGAILRPKQPQREWICQQQQCQL